MLTLSEPDLARIWAQAVAEYPAECCGVVTARDGAEVQVHPCVNIQDRLHAEDPEAHPRDARTAYYIEPQELYDIITGAERDGRQLWGFYHSHIDCPAYFSEEDTERATVWDEPAYPDAAWLVVSVQDGKASGHRCFAWDEASRDFGEVELTVG